MITPSPTSKIDSTIARGTLGAVIDATATRPGAIVFCVPNTSYELHLLPSAPVTVAPGKRLLGTIRAQARRIDVVESGGRYIEPVAGRPRRVQGMIVAIAGDSIVVDASVPVHCKPTDPRQQASQFAPGQFVSFDVFDGSTFSPR